MEILILPFALIGSLFVGIFAVAFAWTLARWITVSIWMIATDWRGTLRSLAEWASGVGLDVFYVFAWHADELGVLVGLERQYTDEHGRLLR